MENVSPMTSRQHGAPTSLHANGMMSPGLPARSRLQQTAGKMPSASIGTDAGESSARPKPKQPFLKRGAGVHKRINPAQQRRYMPKGGFVLQAEQQDDAHSKPPQAMADSRPNRLGKQALAAGFSPCQAISAEADKPASASRDPWDTAPAGVGTRLMQQQSALLQQQADELPHRPQGASSLGALKQQGSRTHAVCDRGTAGQHSDYAAHEGQQPVLQELHAPVTRTCSKLHLWLPCLSCRCRNTDDQADRTYGGVCGSTDSVKLECPGHKHLLPAEEGDLAELASDTAMVQIWGRKGCQAQAFPGGRSRLLSAPQLTCLGHMHVLPVQQAISPSPVQQQTVHLSKQLPKQ